jgi:hypothetical protein
MSSARIRSLVSRHLVVYTRHPMTWREKQFLGPERSGSAPSRTASASPPPRASPTPPAAAANGAAATPARAAAGAGAAGALGARPAVRRGRAVLVDTIRTRVECALDSVLEARADWLKSYNMMKRFQTLPSIQTYACTPRCSWWWRWWRACSRSLGSWWSGGTRSALTCCSTPGTRRWARCRQG